MFHGKRKVANVINVTDVHIEIILDSPSGPKLIIWTLKTIEISLARVRDIRPREKSEKLEAWGLCASLLLWNQSRQHDKKMLLVLRRWERLPADSQRVTGAYNTPAEETGISNNLQRLRRDSSWDPPEGNRDLVTPWLCPNRPKQGIESHCAWFLSHRNCKTINRYRLKMLSL